MGKTVEAATSGQKVQRLISEFNLNVTELADKLGINRVTPYQWGKKPNQNPRVQTVEKIRKFLNDERGHDIPLSWFYDGELDSPYGEPETDAESSPMHQLRGKSGKLKIYGPVVAGPGDEPNSSFDFDEIEVPIEFARPDYGGLIVEGDSMIPNLWPKDITIFCNDRSRKPNQIVAASLENGAWVVKQLVYERDRYALRSTNPEYDDITEGFTVSGFLVGVIRDDGPERMIRLNPFGLKF